MYNWWCDIYIHCEIITTIKLINISISSQLPFPLCVCVCVCLCVYGGNTRSRSTLLGKFKYAIQFLLIVTMLHIRSPVFILYHELCSPWPPSLHNPCPPGNHPPALCFYEFTYFRFHVHVRSCSICLWLISLSIMSSRFIYVVSRGRSSSFLRLKINNIFFLGPALHVLILWETKDSSRIGVRGNYSLCVWVCMCVCACGENKALSHEVLA